MDRGLFETARVLVGLLAARGLTAATAESLTGGMVGAAITAVPGASAVYRGGVISYVNEVKQHVLGVPAEVLGTSGPGAVSEACARAMADGARRLTGADFTAALTGVAGPGPDERGNPAGLVWFAVSSADGVKTDHAIFRGDRAEVRRLAAIHALGLLTVAATPL